MVLGGDLAGDYTIVLTDTYGDGWSWGGVPGGVTGYGGSAWLNLHYPGTRLPVPSPWSLHPLDWLFSASPVVPSTSRLRVACSSPRQFSDENHCRPNWGGQFCLVKSISAAGRSSQGLSRSIKIERCFVSLPSPCRSVVHRLLDLFAAYCRRNVADS